MKSNHNIYITTYSEEMVSPVQDRQPVCMTSLYLYRQQNERECQSLVRLAYFLLFIFFIACFLSFRVNDDP